MSPRTLCLPPGEGKDGSGDEREGGVQDIARLSLISQAAYAEGKTYSSRKGYKALGRAIPLLRTKPRVMGAQGRKHKDAPSKD